MELDQESLGFFIADLDEGIEAIDRGLLELEKNGQVQTLIDSIMRYAHNIKGSSAMVGFDSLKETAHAIENIMIDIKNGKTSTNPTVITLLLKSMDVIKQLRDDFIKGKLDRDVSDIILEIKKSREKKEEKQEIKVEQKEKETIENIQHKTEPVQNIKISLRAAEKVLNHVSELIMLQTQIFKNNKTMKKLYQKDVQFRESFTMIEQMDKEIKKLQDEMLHLSMTSIDNVFRNFPRMVRDLEISLGKKIELIIDSANSRLDRNIAEEIANPLIHILRNSADHGIELPKERAEAGKKEIGRIKIGVRQEGEQLVISVEDDGKGINEEKVKYSAIKNGVITEEQAGSMTKKEIIKLIFSPGFSTADKVTDISGRGVGMDVVLNSIKKINGTIEIDSEQGKGTKISLKIPSTLSVMPCILFELNKRVLCFPAINIDTVLNVEAIEIKKKEQGETISVDEIEIPLIKLYNRFGGTPKRHSGRYYVAVCGLAEKRVAIIVDRILGSQKIIIKPLSRLVGKMPDILGTAILEDGKVALVMDVSGVIEKDK